MIAEIGVLVCVCECVDHKRYAVCQDDKIDTWRVLLILQTMQPLWLVVIFAIDQLNKFQWIGIFPFRELDMPTKYQSIHTIRKGDLLTV